MLQYFFFLIVSSAQNNETFLFYHTNTTNESHYTFVISKFNYVLLHELLNFIERRDFDLIFDKLDDGSIDGVFLFFR